MLIKKIHYYLNYYKYEQRYIHIKFNKFYTKLYINKEKEIIQNLFQSFFSINILNIYIYNNDFNIRKNIK